MYGAARVASSAESPLPPPLAARLRLPHAPFVPVPPLPPPVYLQRPPHNIFDAARFSCDKKLAQAISHDRDGKPRYLDADRERQVTRWLLEANEALSQQERSSKKTGSKKKPLLRRFQWSEPSEAREPWADNFVLADRERDNQSGGGNGDFLPVKEFCARHSLPRVVRVQGDSRPLLLYRLVERHSAVEALRLGGKKTKPSARAARPLMIPEHYNGWFSISSGRGLALAAQRGSVAQLVRTRAQTAVSDRPLPAYRPRHDSEGGGQYERTVAASGEALRLTAVFADGSKPKAPKYVQMIDCNGLEYFVPINTKGDFYEACPRETVCADRLSMPQPGVDLPATPSAEEARFVHRLPHLLSLSALPLRVRLVSGTVPADMAHDFNDDLLLRSVVTEPVVVVYPLPEMPSSPTSPTRASPDGSKRTTKNPECLRLVPLNGDLRVQRTQLGYDSEKRMFLSSKIHRALSFCQYNFDTWIKQLYYARDEDLNDTKFEKERRFTLHALKIDPGRLFGKTEKAHKDMPDENEGSIIFLSKNELRHINYEVEDGNTDEKERKQFTDDKMKVFREEQAYPKRHKWFKHLKLLRSTEKLAPALENRGGDFRDPFDPECDKHRSIERYQDMAKLIEDRFGNVRKNDAASYKSLASSSDLGIDRDKKKILTKSVSVQTAVGSGSNASIDRQTKSTSLEKRQRIQPDLIPSGKDCEFNRIQSCEDLNLNQQNSFITEKLCTEFHVKTKKVLSKSTSNLFHAKKAAEAKREKENSNSMPASIPKVKHSIASIQNRKLPVIEDMPYGQVADAVRAANERRTSETSDNIYAEICSPKPPLDEEESFDFGCDILASDPVISNVKQEIINRNEERTKCENQFRHIEVVVIERNTTDIPNPEETSVTSSEDDYHGYSEDSWEKPKKNHAIRLQITDCPDEYPQDVPPSETNLENGSYVHLQGEGEIDEAIYHTLK